MASISAFTLVLVSHALLLCYLCPAVQSTPFIYVTSLGNDTHACWFGGKENPCRTFQHALQGVQNTSNETYHPGVLLDHGNYTLMNSSSSVFNGTANSFLQDVVITGERAQDQSQDEPPTVRIYCQPNTGLTFFNVSNVTLEHVYFLGCGAEHYSTSKVLSSWEDPTRAKFRVAIFLVFCNDVSFRYVWVDNTPGTGVVIYATTGLNYFYRCYFLRNRYNESDPNSPGGGGLYLEFPYCVPDYVGRCDPQKLQTEKVSHSQYLFQECHMEYNHANFTNQANNTFILPNEKEHVAFGRGGGLSVFFKGKAFNNTVTVNQSYISNNTALWGAGIFAEFQDNSSDNIFHVINSVLESNLCPYNATINEGTGGGGTRFGFLFFGSNHVKMNTINFENCTFNNNTAYYGGGVSFYTAREPNTYYATNSLYFSNCTWHRNSARVGAALDLSVWHAVSNGSTVLVRLKDITVSHHTSDSNLQNPGLVVGLGAMYIDTLPVHFEGYIDFHDNCHTPLAAIHSQIDLVEGCTVNFTNNCGRNGGALALFGSSFIRADSGTEMYFKHNSAQLKGGAIFQQSTGGHDLLSSRNCFIRYTNITVFPDEWNAFFTFFNNTANGEANSIYTTTILPCLWGGAFGSSTQNPVNQVFCWSDKWSYTNMTCPVTNGTGEIQTDPATFHSSTNFNMSMISGQRKSLDISITDDLGNDVTKRTVFLAYVQDTNIAELSSTSKYIADNAVKLYGNPGESAKLQLYTEDPRVLYRNVSVDIELCPPGFLSTSTHNNFTKCTCVEGSNFKELIKCSNSNFTARLQVQGIWIGTYGNSSRTDSTLLAGYCPYTYGLTNEETRLDHNVSNLDAQLCQKPSKRTGILCGECVEGRSPAFNSRNFECTPCNNYHRAYSWLPFLVTEMIPQTVLFAVLVLFNISLTSGPANGFIFFAQVISTSFALYASSVHPYKDAREAYVFFYDVWNLNFFDCVIPNYCLAPDMKTATIIALEYAVAVYPLILIGVFFAAHQLFNHGLVIHRLCQPLVTCYKRVCQRVNLRSDSSIHALTAFLLLSYTKFTIVSVRLLSPSYLYNVNKQHKATVLFFDGSIEYFTVSHAPYIVVAILVLIVFVILPPLVLLVYPIKYVRTLVKWLTCKKVGNSEQQSRFVTEFKHVLDSFYGCYKDGSNGTYDLRWFAGLYFVFRIVFAVLNSLNNFIPWAMQYTLQQLVCTVSVLMFAIVRPYKKDLYNYVDVAFFANLAAINALSHYNYHLAVESSASVGIFVIEYILIWLPLIYMVLYIVWYCYSRYRTRAKRMKQRATIQAADELENDDNSILEVVDSRDGYDEVHDDQRPLFAPASPPEESKRKKRGQSSRSGSSTSPRGASQLKEVGTTDRSASPTYGATNF